MSGEFTLILNEESVRPPNKAQIDLKILPLTNDLIKYNIDSWSGITYDPIYFTPMLLPDQLSTAYNSSVTGNLARLRKSNFNLTADDWEEIEYGFTGNWFLLSKSITEELVYTNFSVEENRGFVTRFFLYPSLFKENLILKLYFGGYRLDIYKNCKTSLYLDESNTYLDSGYISGGYDEDNQYPVDVAGFVGRLIEIVIFPIRRNCIEIISNLGGGWAYENPLSPTSTLGTIIPEGPLKFKFNNEKALIQILPLTYSFTGSLKIKKMLSHKPDNDCIISSIIDEPSDSQININANPTLITNLESSTVIAELEVNFIPSTDGKYTPFVHQLSYTWPTTLEPIPENSPNDITRWRAESATIHLDERPDNRIFKWVVDDADKIEILDGKSNRPITLYYKDVNEIFKGFTNMPSKSDPRSFELECSAQDLWKRLSNCRIRSTLIADGKIHTEFIRDLLHYAGIPDSRIFMQEDTYELPTSGVKAKKRKSDKKNNNNNLIEFEPGETVADIITYINDNFIGWCIGFQPVLGVVKFVYVPLSAYPTTPMKYLYKTIDTSQNIGIDNVYMREGFKIDYIEPEATFIRVIGVDDNDNYIIREYVDEDAENKDLIEAERPVNWLGERRYFGEYNTSWNSEEVVEDVLDIYINKLTRRRKLIEFQASYDGNLWPYYLVWLEDYGTFRIKSVEINIQYDNDFNTIATATYMAEEYVEGVN